MLRIHVRAFLHQQPNRQRPRDSLWLQATSDISGLNQIICEKTVGASYGDAFLASCAVGAADMADIGNWNPTRDKVRAAHHPVYDRQYGLFRQLYEQTRGIAAELDSVAGP